MKNILYIGPYKDINGLGSSSRRYIDALRNNNSINLCIKPVYFTTTSFNNTLDLKEYDEYQDNHQANYDCVIQHGFPEMFVYDKSFGKNIGIVEIETRNIYRSGWINKINLMDEVCVNSINGINCLYDCGVRVPVKLTPEPYNTDTYNKTYDPFFVDITEHDRPFVFYTIGEYTEKKNIKGIVLAYLLEFNKKDNVRLLIKTNSYGLDLKNLDIKINAEINNIKQAIRKKDCPDINIISGYISDTDIKRLHQSSDCYINAVRADGLGPCAVESMLSKKIIINTKNIGSATYFNSGNALMVDSIPVNVYSPEFMNENIFTIYEEWDEPNISMLQQQMRKAYLMNSDEKKTIVDSYKYDIFNQQYFNKDI